MNYIKVEKTKPITLSCKSEMIIFAILTISLLLVTLGYWGMLRYGSGGGRAEKM